MNNNMFFYYINSFLTIPSIERLTPHKDMLKFVKNAIYLKKIENPIGKT
jgi:hypothetical protein